ncbi:MAG: PPOX class F420-dependent oxidoreductase [Acidimicrobiia bacterium]
MPKLDPDAVDAFLAEARNAIVTAIRRDGRPAMTPNWFLWQDGRFYVSTTKTRAKYRLFTNDPRVQLAVDDSTGFRYVVVDGTVAIHDDLDSGLPYFKALRAKHGRGGQSDEDLRAEMVRDQRVLLVITPDKPPSEWLGMGLG